VDADPFAAVDVFDILCRREGPPQAAREQSFPASLFQYLRFTTNEFVYLLSFISKVLVMIESRVGQVVPNYEDSTPTYSPI
jgi:hypothetical protein